MNCTTWFQLVPYLFLRSFFGVFKPFSFGTSSSCVPSQSSNDCFETSIPIESVIRNLLVVRGEFVLGCPSIRVSPRPQPKLESSSPLLILHKLWKGDPS